MANVATTPSLHQQWRHFFSRGQLPLNVSFNILRCNFAQQTLLTSTSRHTIFVFIIPILVNFIEVKYQGKSISPFETHPVTTMVAITSLLIYYLAYGAEQTFYSSTYAYIFCWLMTFSGSLSLASLASILFPESMRFVLYIFYILLSVGELHGIIYKLYHWIRQIIMDKFFNVYHTQQSYMMRRTTRPILPRSFIDVSYMPQM